MVDWPLVEWFLHGVDLSCEHRLVKQMVELIRLVFHVQSAYWLSHPHLISNLVEVLLGLLQNVEISFFIFSKHLDFLSPFW